MTCCPGLLLLKRACGLPPALRRKSACPLLHSDFCASGDGFINGGRPSILSRSTYGGFCALCQIGHMKTVGGFGR